MADTKEQFERVISQCRELFEKKLKDYGPSWRIMRPQSLTDQIFIKANRIRSLEIKGVSMVDEGIRPEFVAIVNYGVIGLIQLAKGFADTTDISNEEALALYDKYITETKELMYAKNHDYGEAWRGMRISSYTDLILMKLYRTKQIESHGGKTIVSEGIDANYMDMINYALFGLIKLEYGEETVDKGGALKILAELCRLLIGVVFIFSGFVKAVDPVGGAIKIGEYLASFGLDMLQPFTVLLSFNLSAIEFALGVCMLLGVYRRYVSFLVLAFMAFMTPLTLYLALFDPVSDCGCFGDALVISNWETFFKNIVLSLAAIVTFIYNQRLFQCFTFRVYWFVALYAYLFGVGFAYYNYNHLPVIDFRPYKVGANIPELMEIPEGAPQDEYKYTFVYEKDGVKKEFSLEDYPANDSSWTFVDSKTELVKKGYQPPVAAFNIYNGEGDDVTEEIIGNPGPVLLLVAPKLEEADDEQMDEINGVYDYALEHDIPFYCVTGSSPEAIDAWSDNTGAEYPFRMADEVLLKTIIRSNPGLVLLKGGTILGKWHYNDIPAEEDVKAVMDRCLDGSKIKSKEDGGLATNLLTFTVPLLLVWMYDLLRFRRKRKEKK